MENFFLSSIKNIIRELRYMYEFTLNESQTGYLKYYSFCLISSSSKIKIFYISFVKGLIKLII